MRFDSGSQTFHVPTEALQLFAKVSKNVHDASSVSLFNYILFDFGRESVVCASEALVCAWVNRAHPTEFIPPASSRCLCLWRPSAIDLLAHATQISRRRTHAPVLVSEHSAQLGDKTVPLLRPPAGFEPTFHESIPPIAAYQRLGPTGRTVQASTLWAVTEALYCLRPAAVQKLQEPTVTMLSASACTHSAPTVFVSGNPAGPYCVCAASTLADAESLYPNPWVKTIEEARGTVASEYKRWNEDLAADRLREIIRSSQLRGKVK